MKLFTNKQFLTFLISVFILIGAILFGLLQAEKLKNSLSWVSNTYQEINQIESLVLNISESESIWLAYLLTDNEIYLKDYNTTISLAQKNLDKIEKLTTKNFTQQEKIKRLRSLYSKKVNMQNKTILLQKYHKLSSKELNLRFLTGRVYLDKIKVLRKEIENDEQSVLTKKENYVDESMTKTMYSILFSFIVSFIVGFFLLLYILRYIKSQKELKDSLVQLNENKNRYFSIISHDLKNPVNNLVRLSEILKEETSEKERNKVSDMIEVSAKKLNSLLSNLLKWAKLQMNVEKTIPEVVLIKKLAEENIILLDELAKSKDLKLINEIKSDTKIWADYEMINTVLRNLISNSIKFTRRGGQITITSENKGNMTEIAVRDNGIGMSKETIENLFEIGIKKTTAGTENELGSGIGLQICKDFIEKNGGTLKVESKLNKGSVFKFTLLSA